MSFTIRRRGREILPAVGFGTKSATSPAGDVVPDQTWYQYAFITPLEMSTYIPGAAEYRHTYNLTDTDGTTVIETGLPKGVTINNRTGRMSGAPVEAQAAGSCTVWGLDAAGAIVGTQTFTITVNAHTGTVRPVSNAAELAAVEEYGAGYTGPGAIIEIAAGATIDVDAITGANWGRFTGYDDATPLVIRSADPNNPGTFTMDTRSWSFDGPNPVPHGNVFFDNITLFRPWQGSVAGPGASLATSPIVTTGGTGGGKGYRNIGFYNCRLSSTVADARTKPSVLTGEMTAFLFNGDSDATSNIAIVDCEGSDLFNFGIFRGLDVNLVGNTLRDSWGDFARIAPNTDLDADNINIIDNAHYGQTCDGLIRHADFVQGASTGGNNRTRNLNILGNIVFAGDQGFRSLPAIAPWFNNPNMVIASTNQTASTTDQILYRLECDVAAGNLTLQLPDISTVPNLFQVCLQNYGVSAFTATALRFGSDTIDGVAADLPLPGNFQAVRFFKNGASATNWTIQRYGPAMQSINLQDDVGLIEYVAPNIAYNICWDTLLLGIGFEAPVDDGLIKHCSVIPDKPQSDIDGSGSIGPEDGAYEIISNPAFAARGGGTLTIENSFAASVFNDSGATITQTNVDVVTLDQVDDTTVKTNLVGIAPQTVEQAIDFARRLPASTLPANCGAVGENLNDGPYDWAWRCMRRGDGVVRPLPTPAGNPATNILFNTDNLTLTNVAWAGSSSALPWRVINASDTVAADPSDPDMFLVTAGALTSFGFDNFLGGRSEFAVPSEAGRWHFSVEVKQAGGAPTSHLIELRDPGAGGDYLRVSFNWGTQAVSKIAGVSNLFGVIDLGGGRYRLWGAIEKPAGNTRLFGEFVRSLVAGHDVKIANPMLAFHAGDTPPDFSHGPTAATIVDQPIAIGAVTLPNAGGGNQAVRSDAVYEPITAITPLTGDTTGIGIANGGIVFSSAVPAGANGATVECTTAAGTFVATLVVSPSVAHVGSVSEADAAIAAAVTWSASFAPTIEFRAGSFRDLVRVNQKAYTNELTITGAANKATTLERVEVRGATTTNVKVAGFNFYWPTETSGAVILVHDSASDIIVEDNVIDAPFIDPAGDYSVVLPARPDGIGSTGTPAPNNVTIRNNTFSNCAIGINTKSTGELNILGNSVSNTFEDSIKVGTPDGNTYTRVNWNTMSGVIANANDAGNPHPDFLQFLGSSTQDVVGEVIGNTTWDLYLRAGAQHLFMDDMGPGFWYTMQVRGNVCYCLETVSAIRIAQAKDCFVSGNTIVSASTTTATPGIYVGTGGMTDRSTGTHYISKNVSDVLAYVPADVVAEDNIVLGKAGATIPYATVFDGLTFFDPFTTVPPIRSAFSRKAAGPLDLGGQDIGALGSGYVTWPSTIPGSDGSIDASYHPGYSQNLVGNQGTGCFTTTSLAGAADSEFLTLSFTADFVSDVDTTNIFFTSGRSFVSRAGQVIRVFLRATTGAILYDAITPAIPASSGLRHILISADTGGSPTVNIYLDGIDISGSMIVTTAVTAGTIDHTRPGYGVLCSDSGTAIPDVEQISDFFLDITAALPITSFYNSGPLDLTGVGSPIIWLGSNMTANERAGNATQGWNDGHNLGSGGSLTVFSPTFVDVMA